MRIGRRLGFTLCTTLFTACGGKVVFDGGSGGTSSTQGASSTHAASSTSAKAGTNAATASASSGNDCQALKAQMEKDIVAARECSTVLSVVQCNGSIVINDECGCPSLVLNEDQPAKAMAAKSAYAAWTKAGCGPFACGASCTPAKGGACIPDMMGMGGGTCTAVMPAG